MSKLLCKPFCVNHNAQNYGGHLISKIAQQQHESKTGTFYSFVLLYHVHSCSFSGAVTLIRLIAMSCDANFNSIITLIAAFVLTRKSNETKNWLLFGCHAQKKAN